MEIYMWRGGVWGGGVEVWRCEEWRGGDRCGVVV